MTVQKKKPGAGPSREDLLSLEKALTEINRRKKYNKLDFYKPYPKQQAFHDMGATMRERLLAAGNQTGKTYSGAAEAAFHLTGRYPEDWLGRRWDRPVKAWVAGVTSESTRDNPQRLLCGELKDGWGTGAIPFDTVNWDKSDTTKARGVSDLFDTVLVDHVSGGKSQLQFKSYERGREKWQGDTLDFIWFDEEPPEDIYSEGLTRITATDGMVFTTFTPLNGWTGVVTRFFQPDASDEGQKHRGMVQMTIEDAQHIPAEKRAMIIAGWLPHEREARKNGIPMMGSGKVFQTLEADLMVQPFNLPDHWRYLWGLDFGQEHPFAAVLLAWDGDSDTVYVVHTVRMKDTLPLQHTTAMKAYKHGGLIPVAWPQDGWVRKEFGGVLTPAATIYRSHGVKMLPHHATFIDGSNSTELGIMQMTERMTTNRFKVFASCTDWFEEYRTYHRKDGQLVKIMDDIMSATRVAIMQLRSAKAVMYLGDEDKNQTMAKGLDFDLFGG